MTESTRKKIVYSVSALVVVWSLANIESDKKDSQSTSNQYSSSQPSTPIVEKVLPSADKIVINIEQKRLQEWGGDPFRDEHIKKTTKNRKTNKLSWILSGIVYNSKSPVACINKKAVRVGDTVGKAKVVNIERTSATLEYNGDRFVIHVKRG